MFHDRRAVRLTREADIIWTTEEESSDGVVGQDTFLVTSSLSSLITTFHLVQTVTPNLDEDILGFQSGKLGGCI